MVVLGGHGPLALLHGSNRASLPDRAPHRVPHPTRGFCGHHTKPMQTDRDRREGGVGREQDLHPSFGRGVFAR